MAIIAYALPIVAGQAESARRFAPELDAAGHRARYEELNRRAAVRRHREWIQATPAGDQLVVVFEIDRPELLARAFEDDEYDRWWRARVERVHGFDPAAAGALPELTYSWPTEG
jgi:hypothetical protein